MGTGFVNVESGEHPLHDSAKRNVATSCSLKVSHAMGGLTNNYLTHRQSIRVSHPQLGLHRCTTIAHSLHNDCTTVA